MITVAAEAFAVGCAADATIGLQDLRVVRRLAPLMQPLAARPDRQASAAAPGTTVITAKPPPSPGAQASAETGKMT